MLNLQDSEGNTPLHLVAGCRNCAIVERLVRAEVDTTIRNKSSDTALREAVNG